MAVGYPAQLLTASFVRALRRGVRLAGASSVSKLSLVLLAASIVNPLYELSLGTATSDGAQNDNWASMMQLLQVHEALMAARIIFIPQRRSSTSLSSKTYIHHSPCVFLTYLDSASAAN